MQIQEDFFFKLQGSSVQSLNLVLPYSHRGPVVQRSKWKQDGPCVERSHYRSPSACRAGKLYHIIIIFCFPMLIHRNRTNSIEIV